MTERPEKDLFPGLAECDRLVADDLLATPDVFNAWTDLRRTLLSLLEQAEARAAGEGEA